MNQSPLPLLSGRKDRTTTILAAIVGGVTIVMLAAVYFMMGGSETPAVRAQGGHRFGAAAPKAQTPMPPQKQMPQPQPPQEQAAPASDSLAFVTNKEGFPQLAGNGPAGTVSASQRALEKQFLLRNGGMLKQCQAGINAAILRRWKTNPVLREMDEDLTHLDKFMAVKRRYRVDGDIYQWARDTAALPELRATIRKYMAKPEAWSVGIDLTLDIIKAAPALVYKEFIRMLVSDPPLRDFTNNIATEGAAYLPGAMTAAATKGKDVSPLNKAISDLSLNKR